jgi:hypothetical protein
VCSAVILHIILVHSFSSNLFMRSTRPSPAEQQWSEILQSKQLHWNVNERKKKEESTSSYWIIMKFFFFLAPRHSVSLSSTLRKERERNSKKPAFFFLFWHELIRKKERKKEIRISWYMYIYSFFLMVLFFIGIGRCFAISVSRFLRATSYSQLSDDRFLE